MGQLLLVENGMIGNVITISGYRYDEIRDVHAIELEA